MPLTPPDYSELLAELLENGTPGLVLYARQWLFSKGMASAAEDVVQDALLRLVEMVNETGRPPESPRAWLFRVVRNAAIDRCRHENRYRQEPVPNWFLEVAEQTQGTPLFDGEDLTRALEMLEMPLREIVVSKIWGGLTFREIAELTGRPSSSVHCDYQKALERLKGILRAGNVAQ